MIRVKYYAIYGEAIKTVFPDELRACKSEYTPCFIIYCNYYYIIIHFDYTNIFFHRSTK